MPSMESDLRRGIAGAMADSLDDQVIDGNGTAPNLSGLFHQATNVTAATAVETFSPAWAGSPGSWTESSPTGGATSGR